MRMMMWSLVAVLIVNDELIQLFGRLPPRRTLESF